MESIKQIVEEIFSEVVSIRRTLHQIPEIAFEERKTADFICNYLDSLHIPYTRNIAKTGIVGLIEVDKKAKTLLLRADIDALPVTEETGLSYASKTPGMMHACGHDGHTAILLGCATVLSRLKDRLSCNIKLVFQPAEEAAGGALPMIEEGIMENPHVDICVGGHIMNTVPVGKILVKSGEMMAAPDDFEMTVTGKGGHGAYPHNCIDPISITTQILSAWQALSARYTTPLEKHVLSVNMFQAGCTYNVIPDKAEVKGTVRVFDKKLRQTFPCKMKKIAEHIATSFGATCDFRYIFRYPPLINDEKITKDFTQESSKILGEENIVFGTEPSMAGEDFSYFAERVPSTYINIGGGNEEIGAVMPLHSSDFIFDEKALKIGILVYCQFALSYT